MKIATHRGLTWGFAAVLALVASATAEVPRGENLLTNAGAEDGSDGPGVWETFTPGRAQSFTFTWDQHSARTGKRCLRIDGRGRGIGLWRQWVKITGGAVYVVGGWVKLDISDRESSCCIQVVFRDAERKIIRMLYFVTHRGKVDWMIDLPHPLRVRAPDNAVVAEVNCLLQGSGTAWFDDLHFARAPSGSIRGTVTCGDKPVSGATVGVWGWGKEYQTATDETGRYEIADVPCASPRYILLASKDGYNTAPAGDIDIPPGGAATVDFRLRRGDDRFHTDLRVKFGSLRRCTPRKPDRISPDAVIDAKLYPANVRVYLQPSECIDSDHAAVRKVAADILASLPAADRRKTLPVAQAAYAWIIRNVEFDTTYDTDGRNRVTNMTDVTSGKWQTISEAGWCWGHNFTDWLYKPSEAIDQRRGICIEHSRLATAVLRALGIPARPMKPYQAQFWVQMPSGEGHWAAMGTSGGRAALRDRGDPRAGFGQLSPANVHIFPADAGPIIHSDWRTDNKCLWREEHPWGAIYRGDAEGRKQALVDLASFAKTGSDPRRAARHERGPRDPRDLLQLPALPKDPRWSVAYSDFTLNLSNIGDQRIVHVRFPFPIATKDIAFDPADRQHWTNRPEWVKRTWVSEEVGKQSGVKRLWFNIEFDLTPLFNAP